MSCGVSGPAEATFRAIRWRRLFRSDALNELSQADVHRITGDLRVTTVVDLRTAYERDRDARRPLEHASVEIVHAPLINKRNAAIADQPGLTLAERYVKILEYAGEPLVRAVAAVAHAPEATVVHCAAGKDRTGLVIAAILGALGVGSHDIAADYALTADQLGRIEQRLLRHAESHGYVPGRVMAAPAGAMLDVLAALEAGYGSMSGFLHQAGLAPETVDTLRAALVE